MSSLALSNDQEAGCCVPVRLSEISRGTEPAVYRFQWTGETSAGHAGTRGAEPDVCPL